MRLSLRSRLLAGTLLLVAAGLVVADVATYRFLRSFLMERVDRQLTEAAPAAARALAAGDGPALPRFPGIGRREPVLAAGTYAAVVDGRGRVLRETTFTFGEVAQSPPPLTEAFAAGEGPDAGAAFTVGGTSERPDYRLLPQALPGGATLVVAVPLTDVAETLRRLVGIEVLATVAILAAVAAVAHWVVRSSLRPLDRMAVTAGEIAAGDLSRRVAPTDDRTEVGRLGASLNEMLAQIERAFEERRRSEARLRRFVADASHELRTPLTSIRGYAELFRRGAAGRPEDLANAMRRIEDEGARMSVLVEELLELARLDRGRPLDHEPVDLRTVLTAAVEAARAVEPGRRVEVEANGPVVVRGDAIRLRQVMDNLLTNARVHTPAGAGVRVRLAAEGGAALLDVADEGPGIPPEDAERVFEPFFRRESSRSRDHGGAGLGLSIVAAVCRAHGGHVRHEPARGGGAMFRVVLPLA